MPKEIGDRLYKTGDWGYLRSDGSLEICGRCDTMVKIRGYTVELQVNTLIIYNCLSFVIYKQLLIILFIFCVAIGYRSYYFK